jgi:hypothetical protein
LVVCHNLTVAGIDELRFSSSGGVNAGFGFSGEHFIMDNMSFNQQQVVPEPMTMVLLATGLVGVGVIRRRVRARTWTPVLPPAGLFLAVAYIQR